MTARRHLIEPMDEANTRLVGLTHPPDRPQPTPADRYQLVVVGGGPAGLVCAFGAAGLGAKVALVERGLLGGDCLIVGCVPSKALLASAHAAHAARHAGALGVDVGEVSVDFGKVMQRMRTLRADIAPHDAVARLEAAGVDVFLGEGRFTGLDTVRVGDLDLRFARAVIATGARASRPPIPGLDAVDVLDNERLFELTELPPRLAVLGAGPIGAEMAQAFARFGSEVTLIDAADRVLPRDDPAASALLGDVLAREGVALRLGAPITELRQDGDDKVIVLGDGGAPVRADAVLVALGRTPNVERLGLDAAGVEADRRGVQTDAKLRTANPRIYAAGDVAGRWQFTHSADAMARAVLQNALVLPTKGVDGLVMPWVTYTDPEVAHVGPAYADLAARTDLTAVTEQLADADRGVTDATTEGFTTLWVDRRGKVVAGTMVGPGAGEQIGELAVAITNGLSVGALAATIHPYPTRAETIVKAANAYNRTRFTPTAKRLLGWWMRWRLG